MKITKPSAPVIVSATITLLLSGCASTGPQPPEPLTLKSDTVYQFKDSRSYALNVAEMTNKTAGLRDVEVPEDAQSRISGAETGLALFAGGMSSGVFGLVGMSSIYGDAHAKRNWRPMYIFTDIPADEATSPTLTQEVEKLIDAKLKEAFQDPRMEDYTYVGLAHDERQSATNYNIYYSGTECSAFLDSVDSDGLSASFGNFGVFGSIQFSGPTCLMATKISIEQIAEIDSVEKLVVVMEQFNSYQATSPLAQSIDGYALIPETYTDGRGTVYRTQAPHLISNEQVHVFSKDIGPFELSGK